MTCRRIVAVGALAIIMLSFSGPATKAAQDPNLKQLFVAYWTTADGYQSIVQLHNNLRNSALSVRPIMLTHAGQRIELEKIQLEPLGNASLNIGEALRAAGIRRIESGSAIFEYSRTSGRALGLGAEISVLQVAKTLSYTITGAESGASGADQAAVFWLPSTNGEAYIALQNTSMVSIRVSASLELGGRSSPFYTVSLGALESKVVKVPVDDLSSDSSASANRYGGIILSHEGPKGSLNTSGWIEDERTGYATMMTFQDTGRLRGNELFGTQILLGQQKDLIPSGAINIDSYLVLFNSSSNESIVARPEFIYEQAGQIYRIPLGIPAIGPRQAVEMDLSSLQKDKIVSRGVSSGSLVVNYTGPKGSLVGRVFGIGSDPSFGFYWTLEGYTPFAINEIYWTTAEDAVTILSVANFRDTSDEITIVMTYNGGTVTLPKISLQPYQSQTLNIRDVMRRGLLPPDAGYGGFRIFGTSTQSKILVKEHVISDRMRMATPFYGSSEPVAEYLYMTTSIFGESCQFGCSPPQFDLQTEDTADVYAFVHWSDGFEGSPNSSAWSDDPSVAAVSCCDVITAVAAGTTTVNHASFEPTVYFNGEFYYEWLYAINPAQVTVAQRACEISVNFSGSKSALDNLVFPSGDQTLGLKNLALVWIWQVEVSGEVSDNAASTWTLRQSYHGRLKRVLRNADGTLDPQTDDMLTKPNDDPLPQFRQQPVGAFRFFWIDGPGHSKGTEGKLVDSLTQVINFTSSATKGNASCSKDWFLKLVVSPGGNLDMQNTTAGLGTASLDF